MKLLEKVKKRLEENYGIDFLSEFWTDDQIVLLEDIVDATEKEVNNINYISAVSHRRELLLAFAEYMDRENDIFVPSWAIDNYLNSK